MPQDVENLEHGSFNQDQPKKNTRLSDYLPKNDSCDRAETPEENPGYFKKLADQQKQQTVDDILEGMKSKYSNGKTATELLEEYKKPVENALRYNEGKVQWSQMHYKSMEPMIRVLEFGSRKYAPGNWKKPMDLTKILECIQRHIAAIMDGEVNDSESGLPHMAHVQCNAMFYNFHVERLKNEQTNATI